jgi:uncharacterized protein (TIGR02588 family)
MSGRRRSGGGPAEHAVRSAPEWVVFGVSALVLGIVVITLIALAFSGSDPAEPVVEVRGAVTQVGDQYFVPVDVVNRGDRAAAEVQVQAELTIDGETNTADQVVDFLGKSESRRLTFVFDDDPADGELVTRVVSFAEP